MRLSGLLLVFALFPVCEWQLDAAEVPSAIAWYGTLEGGLAAAQKSGRPILLLSAAPHCHGISGIW
jgi:hypothetical protein